jgi:hypothetical protein
MKLLLNTSLLLLFINQLFAIEPPILLSPEDEAINQPTELTLDWEGVAGASIYEYQYSTSSSFMTYWNDYLGDTEAVINALNNNYTYYWRVRASDGGAYSDWSEVWSFTTIEAGAGLATPTLVAPADNANNVLITPQLLWNIVPNANEYEYQYSIDETFATFSGSTTQSTAISIGDLEYDTQYFWRIQATDGTQVSDWSAIWSFITEDDGVGVQEEKLCEISIYPNPANDFTTLKSDNQIDYISITDFFGKEVYQKTTSKNTYLLRTKSLPSGVYFIRIISDNKQFCRKIVINH